MSYIPSLFYFFYYGYIRGRHVQETWNRNNQDVEKKTIEGSNGLLANRNLFFLFDICCCFPRSFDFFILLRTTDFAYFPSIPDFSPWLINYYECENVTQDEASVEPQLKSEKDILAISFLSSASSAHWQSEDVNVLISDVQRTRTRSKSDLTGRRWYIGSVIWTIFVVVPKFSQVTYISMPRNIARMFPLNSHPETCAVFQCVFYLKLPSIHITYLH